MTIEKNSEDEVITFIPMQIYRKLLASENFKGSPKIYL